MKIGIIGSGVSGLSAAAFLARARHRVVLFEQAGEIGGVTAGLQKDGYRWDLGQMLLGDLGPGEPGRRALDRLGVSDKVELVPSSRGNVFPDFQFWKPGGPPIPGGRRSFLKGFFPTDAAGIERYYALYERMHDLSTLQSRTGLAAKVRLLLKFLPIRKMKTWSARRLMDAFFADHRLKAVYTSILADYVTKPEDFPGLLLPLINAEQQYDERQPLEYGGHEHRSSWGYIRGGCARLVSALADAILAAGGEIRTNVCVEKVLVGEGAAKALRLEDGSEEPIDAVVASGGAKELFRGLVGAENLPADFVASRVDNLATTESVFMVHLGVDYDAAACQHGSALCYYYLSYDVDGAIEECSRGVYHEGRHGFLVYIPSVHSPEMAPPGHQAVTVYTIAPNEPTNGAWSVDSGKWADILLGLAERYVPGLRAHEKTRVVLTPEYFRARTRLARHAFGGCPPRLDRSPPPHKTPIRGLWFVGAQSEAYGGVTGGILSGQKAAEGILRERR